MGKKMAGTNEFAFFRCRSICTEGVQNQAEKNAKQCLPAGTGTKIYLLLAKNAGGEARIAVDT